MPDIVALGRSAQQPLSASAVVDPIMSPIERPSQGRAEGSLYQPQIIPILTGAEKLESDLFKNRAELKLLTSKVAMHLSFEQRQSLFLSIDRLLAAEEWEDESYEIDLESFQSFLRFVIHAKIEHMPNIGVGPGGTVLAGWHAKSKSVHAEFFPADHCMLMIKLQSDRGLERFAWRGHVARLRDVVFHNGAIECL
ncbi:MAG TPA: hypothetical protein VND87_12645 [Stellaceae bacterium]|nr:hypothetical protein [Stellaceae bacterium]